MAIAQPDVAITPEGVTAPRIAPPSPAKSKAAALAKIAKSVGITLMPHQEIAGRYLTATGPDGWLFREVAIVMARQNGKTEMLVPRIIMDLRAGKRILHTAHRMRLARKVFLRVARIIGAEAEVIRWAQGQEEVFMPNGGSYVTIAAQRGARGESADTLIVDEVREFEDFDVMAAAGPTLSASEDPQIIYLSNAGSDASVVLNDLRRRGEAGEDAELAYLEWSASPERRIDDRYGWAQANPALGRLKGMARNLEKAFIQYVNSDPATFKTEHLCQWVESMLPQVVGEVDWQKCRGDVSTPERPAVAFNMAPDGSRASAAMAWPMADGRVALVELMDVPGHPIEVERLGPDLKALIVQHRARKVAFASWTDASLARYLPNAKPMDGKDFATACGDFARLVQSGRLVWDEGAHISEDLAWTARKPHEASGAWHAVPATPERPVTAVLAAIRAVSLASAPKPPMPRIG